MVPQLDPEEQGLLADPRLAEAIRLFNAGEWYACHDGFEELWHETAGAMRPVLQGILQIAVGELHLERGNRRGATILMGEGVGRLSRCPQASLGINLDLLRQQATARLQALQGEHTLNDLPTPQLRLSSLPETSVD